MLLIFLGMFGPGSYHTIAHYQLYKRPIHVDYCSPAPPAPEHFVHRSHFMSLEPPSAVPADFVKTLGRTRRESPMATKAIGKKHQRSVRPVPQSVTFDIVSRCF